jgi:PAS domain S-box-containing protein
MQEISMKGICKVIGTTGRVMKKSMLTLIIGLTLSMTLLPPHPVYGQSRGIALFVPRVDSFWEKSIFLARNAAAELGVPLEVYDSKGDPRQMIEQVKAAVRQGTDGIIFPAFQGTGKQILEMAEEYKVPSLLIVSGIPDILPQTKYKYLRASILPNDEKAGTLLIRQLIGEAEKKGLENIHVLAIQGNAKDLSSEARLRGLTQYLKNTDNVASFKTVTGDGKRETSYQAFKNYYEADPEVNVVWCVNDQTALGAVKAIEDLGIRHTVLVGGMGWDKDALLEIGQGRMQVSVGGDFLAGAWAVVLLYDTLNGFGFLNEGTEIEAEMVALSGRNLHHFTPILSSGSYPRNFSHFSKAQNPSLKLYRFDLQRISAGLAEPETGIHLTEREKGWLSEHKSIRMGVDPNYAPYAFVDGGQYEGVSAEFIQIMNEKLGITMEMVPGPTISEMVERVRDRTLDLITTIRKTPEREQFMNFTQSYIPTPLIIVTRKDYTEIKRRDDIAGKKIALVKDWSSSKKIAEQFPTVEPFWVSEPLGALRALSTGQADAYVGSEGTISYLVTKNSITNLKMASVFEEGADGQRFGVRKDWPELVSILDKALESIPERKRLEIMSKWISLGPAPEAKKELVLTEEEKAWLSGHKDIRLGIFPNRPPFEFLDAAKVYSGIASDYVRRLSEVLGINMVPVAELTAAEGEEKIKAGELDVIPCVANTPERTKFLLFTKPYASFPMVIVTKQDAPFVNGVQDFADHRLAAVKGSASQLQLERAYPSKKFYVVGNAEEGLTAVSKGKVDAYADSLAIISYNTELLGLSNLKVAATTPFVLDLGFGVRGDWPMLVSLLEKTLDSIPNSEKAAINSRWINVRFERGMDWSLIYKIVIPILLVGGLLLVTFVAWNRRLSREVTQRKLAEEAIRNSEERLGQTIDFLPDATMVVDNDGKVVAWNKAMEKLTGIKTEDILGKGDYEYALPFYGERRPLLVNLIQQWDPSYEKRYLSVKKEGENLVSESFHPHMGDGGLYLSGIAGLLNDASGKAAGAIEALRNITEKKRAEMELKKAQEQLAEVEERSRLLLQSAGEGIVGADPNGRITFVNPSAARMLGYSIEELVGQSLHDLVHHTRADGSPYPKENCPMYESYTTGKANQVDDEVLWRKDGSSFPVGYSSTPVTKEGTVVGAVVTFRDITERKKMDAELKEYVADLERFNRLVIGREERMIQLKEEINGLMEKLGEEKKYKIVQ